MKYSSYINNTKAIEWNLSLSEAVIVDYIVSIVGDFWIKNFIIDGFTYWWISKTKIISDLPLLTDKEDTVYRLLKSLDSKGIIKYIKKDGKDLIAITAKASSWTVKQPESNSEKNPSKMNNSEINPSELGNKSEKEQNNSEKNPTYYKTSLLEGEGLEGSLQPSNSFSNLPPNPNSLSGGTNDIPSPSPSNAPQPPDIKTLGVKMCDLLRKRMRSEMDDILSRTELDLPTLSEMFAEYWVYNKGRDFDPKNHKGITSSFQKWFDVGGSKELPQKEISNGIKGKTIMEEIIEIVRKKKGIEMTNDEATSVKMFLAKTVLDDQQLKLEVTRRFLAGAGTTWKTWLTIAGNVQDEEIYHRRLNGKVLV